MAKMSGNQYRLEKIKKQAKTLSKQCSIPLTQALEEIAKELGYQSWFDCRNQVLNGAAVDTETLITPEKVFAHDYDPEIHSPQDVRGVTTTGDGYNLAKRSSLLNYIGEHFDSVNSFRNRLESEIRDIISNSKRHVEIHVTLYASSSILDQIEAHDRFFDSILNRYQRLTTLHVVKRDTHLTFDEYDMILRSMQGDAV